MYLYICILIIYIYMYVFIMCVYIYIYLCVYFLQTLCISSGTTTWRSGSLCSSSTSLRRTSCPGPAGRSASASQVRPASTTTTIIIAHYADVRFCGSAPGPGSGVPFHWHGPGFSEVIYGRKVTQWTARVALICVPARVTLICVPLWPSAVVPVPAPPGASLPPQPHHPVLGHGDVPAAAGGRGAAGVHHLPGRGRRLLYWCW